LRGGPAEPVPPPSPQIPLPTPYRIVNVFVKRTLNTPAFPPLASLESLLSLWQCDYIGKTIMFGYGLIQDE
jgi:hypothetical protein